MCWLRRFTGSFNSQKVAIRGVTSGTNKRCLFQSHSGSGTTLACIDGHRCDFFHEGWNCCQHHGGKAQCPSSFPVMCRLKKCAHGLDYCCQISEHDCTVTGRGGARQCRSDAFDPGLLLTGPSARQKKHLKAAAAKGSSLVYQSSFFSKIFSMHQWSFPRVPRTRGRGQQEGIVVADLRESIPSPPPTPLATVALPKCLALKVHLPAVAAAGAGGAGGGSASKLSSDGEDGVAFTPAAWESCRGGGADSGGMTFAVMSAPPSAAESAPLLSAGGVAGVSGASDSSSSMVRAAGVGGGGGRRFFQHGYRPVFHGSCFEDGEDEEDGEEGGRRRLWRRSGSGNDKDNDGGAALGAALGAPAEGGWSGRTQTLRRARRAARRAAMKSFLYFSPELSNWVIGNTFGSPPYGECIGAWVRGCAGAWVRWCAGAWVRG